MINLDIFMEHFKFCFSRDIDKLLTILDFYGTGHNYRKQVFEGTFTKKKMPGLYLYPSNCPNRKYTLCYFENTGTIANDNLNDDGYAIFDSIYNLPFRKENIWNVSAFTHVVFNLYDILDKMYKEI